MKHTLHHLRWLLRRFRLTLVGYVIAWALLFLAVWQTHALGRPLANGFLFFLHCTLPVVAIIMLREVLWQDAAPGTREFWRTRPPRWRAVWGSQAIFLVILAAPPLAGWLINGLLLRSNAMQWRYGAVDAMLILCPLLALAGIVSFSRGWYSLLLSLVAAAGCVMGGVMLASIGTGFFALACLLASSGLILAISWTVGMRRPGVRWRAALTGIALFLAPLLVPRTNVGSAEQTLTLTVNTQPRLSPDDEEPDPGGLLLHDVPDNAEAVITQSDVRVTQIDSDDAWDRARVKDMKPYKLWSGLTNVQHRFHAIPNKGLSALFPSGTRWYTDIINPTTYREGFDYVSRSNLNLIAPEIRFRLAGSARGYFVSAQRLTSIPLESGAGASGNGARAQLREIEVSAETLTLRAELWRGACMGEPVPPHGLMMEPDFFAHRYLPVLYFPAVSMAILMDDSDPGDDDRRQYGSRSWQCVNRSLSLRATLPTAEAIRGTRFTPDVMRGAQMVLCVPVVTGYFTASAPRETQAIAQAQEAGSEEKKLERLLASLRGSYGVKDGQRIRPPAIAELRQMGAPAVRAMLRRSWDSHGPLNEPEEFMGLWQGWLTDDFLPDLVQAVKRDHRWMRVAWVNGQADKLADAALDIVRQTHAPLSLWIVAVAAGHARPDDYDQLRHHMLIVPTGTAEGSAQEAITALWQRLRALPDFPWRDLARERWQAIQNEGDNQPDGRAALLTAAVLAGEASALNALLEIKPRDDYPAITTLSASEWTELAGMIDGLPATGPERTKWLRDNRGYFSWDSARDRYVVTR